MQHGLCGDAASNDPSCGPGSVKGRGRPQGLKQLHTDITWHAKVAVSLPSAYVTGLVDLIGLLGWGRRSHQPGSWHRPPPSME
ncbi:Hypothetical protein FKW44_012724 [Caligus rogercresseyi]|uniref:Uncharacterized protein n=1 Tax=Caligus rogercresseyi TaxID=217165 RepID=A0A7T8HJW5_CALRO|nr:Hypothetical protein FKW44_012724 [Caligus rogercresseyi]